MTDSNDDDRIFDDAYHEAMGEVFGHSPTCDMHPNNRGKGPAQVATPAYRENYDVIFGRVPVGKA